MLFSDIFTDQNHLGCIKKTTCDEDLSQRYLLELERSLVSGMPKN